ncbi:hypothetical protein [Pantoea agglomerans]|uniref:hypothetical protein n=1 Tax=Enterobacter agglomerans TaxID=549 RepID=UPI00301D75DC
MKPELKDVRGAVTAHPAIKKALTKMTGLNKKSLEGNLPIVGAKITQKMEK